MLPSAPADRQPRSLGQRKHSFPRSLPELEYVNGSYVISSRSWDRLNQELHFKQGKVMRPRPPPPDSRPRNANFQPSDGAMRGLQTLFDATTRAHELRTFATQLEELNTWHGMTHLAAAVRRVSRAHLALPRRVLNQSDVEHQMTAAKIAELWHQRESWQKTMIDEQLERQAPKKDGAEEWYRTAQLENKLSELNDTRLVADVDRTLKRENDLNHKRELLAAEREQAAVEQHRMRAEARRELLRLKRERLDEQEKEVDSLFAESQRLADKWGKEKVELGMPKGRLEIDLTDVDPRTGCVIGSR
ncbi:hypothetical protein DIPPA_10802 [Diplonema papillatum]|nr:hypothetical protein DIPPA_10802 [Diplonema papillatum]